MQNQKREKKHLMKYTVWRREDRSAAPWALTADATSAASSSSRIHLCKTVEDVRDSIWNGEQVNRDVQENGFSGIIIIIKHPQNISVLRRKLNTR